jgi:SAM-dependent methyltransferase
LDPPAARQHERVTLMARRLCPSCRAEQTIDSTEAVFPPQWACPHCGQRPIWKDGFPLLAPSDGDGVRYDAAMFAVLAAVEDRHFWYAPRARLIAGLVAKLFPVAQSVLEIGCGTGFVLAALARARRWQRIAGTDYHCEGLALARRRLGAAAELLQADARLAPVADTFDVIAMLDVIEHMPDERVVLAAARRMLTARGGIVVAAPQHPWLWSRFDEAAGHVRRYRRGELEQTLATAGFHVVFSTSYVMTLLPVMAASRLLLGRKASALAAAPAARPGQFQFTPPRAINALLRAPLELEAALALRGVRLPVGGSRIIVAEKR